MTISALTGPVVSFGQGVSSDSNPERGPSAFDQGLMLADPRAPFCYAPGSNAGRPFYGWLGGTDCAVLDVVPYTLTVGAIAPAAHAVNGTAMTLLAATADGVTVGASVVNAATGALVSGLLAIGGAMGSVAFGSAGTVNAWDPTKALARAVSVTGVAAGSGGAFKVVGYDLYGYPMTETITAPAGVATTNGKKAWKYIASVTPQFSDANNYSVDTTDIIGFPLRVDEWGYQDLTVNATCITASTGFVAADTTSPATSITGDTRGTYAMQNASDNTLRIIFFVSPSVANISSAVGLTGVTPA